MAETNQASAPRIQSLDQFRGYTVVGMFCVNFLGDYWKNWPILSQLEHHNTHFDYADSIMPSFFFAVGFAFRVASDHRRLVRHRVEVLGSSVEPIDPASTADDQIEAVQERALVEEALDSVPLERRGVLVLHDVDDVPVPAIARELGIPLATAYSRLPSASKLPVSTIESIRAGVSTPDRASRLARCG